MTSTLFPALCFSRTLERKERKMGRKEERSRERGCACIRRNTSILRPVQSTVFTIRRLNAINSKSKPRKRKKPHKYSNRGMAADWPTTRKEFVKWFWSGKNGNELIKELNCSTWHGEDYIRREKQRPTIYGIVLNHGSFPGKEGQVRWKLCKVGFTHVSTATETQNRMEQVKAEIKGKFNSKRKDRKADAAVLFVLLHKRGKRKKRE